jgi:thiamine-monophosphate kinase
MILDENLSKKINLVFSDKNKIANTTQNNFESIKINGENLLYSMKEFSKDNLFRENDPYILGWNIAVAGLSNILAGGAVPRYYVQFLTFCDKWSDDYILNFAKGISDVLSEYKIENITSEYKKSSEWRFTLSCIGDLSVNKKSDSAKIGDNIYISGYIGRGNVEAFLLGQNKNRNIARLAKSYKNRFRARIKEAKLINDYSSSCVVTSEGVLNALDLLLINKDLGYKLEGIPYVKSGMLAVKMLDIPKELLLTGEFGEYELLFTVKDSMNEEFLSKIKENNLNFYNIGKVTNKNIKELIENDKTIELKNINTKNTFHSKLNEYRKIFISLFKN